MTKEVATDDDDDKSCDSTHRKLVFSIQDQDAHLVLCFFLLFSGDLPIQVQKESYSHLWASEISFDH